MRPAVKTTEMLAHVKVFLVIGVVHKVLKWHNTMEENFRHETKQTPLKIIFLKTGVKKLILLKSVTESKPKPSQKWFRRH